MLVIVAAFLPAMASAAELAMVGSWGTQGAAPNQFDLLADLVVMPDGSV